jgi:hypothetical protein
LSYLYNAWEIKTSRLKYHIIDIIAHMESSYLKDNKELRRVQALHGERSLTIVLPKTLASQLGIVKGDYLKYLMEGNRLIMEKVET